MSGYMYHNKKFSRVLEPRHERVVTANQVASLSESQMENIDKIQFTPPKMGNSGFGEFKIIYKTPVLCEAGR